jgi:CRISPR/Cas system endoribonuclease Cas6 (RAMP superfamily)
MKATGIRRHVMLARFGEYANVGRNRTGGFGVVGIDVKYFFAVYCFAF